MDILNKLKEDTCNKKLLKDSCKIAKGRILKVKPGYNPNSSSMGSIIYSFPQIMLGITTIFGVVSGLIISRFMNKNKLGIQDKSKNTDANDV